MMHLISSVVKKNSPGYSIIEVIVAASLLGIAISGSVSYFQRSQRAQKHHRVSETMFSLHRQISKKIASASSIVATINQDDGSIGNQNLVNCILSPLATSTCEDEAKDFPGFSYNAYFQDDINMEKITGVSDDPVLYNIYGKKCDPDDCREKDHITARSWYVVNCVDNSYKSSKCSRRSRGRGTVQYQADVIYVFAELEFISRKRTQKKIRWNNGNSQFNLQKAMDGSGDRKYFYVIPEPTLKSPGVRRAFYIPIAVEKIASAFNNDGCNENAVVVGNRSNGSPICSCVPPFQPVVANGEIAEDNKGPICEMKGICPEGKIFRGYQIFERNLTTDLSQDLRVATRPICKSFEEAYTGQKKCDNKVGSRLQKLEYECVMRCEINPQTNVCRSQCRDDLITEAQCYQPK